MVTYCIGAECAVKNTCLRYTEGRNLIVGDGCDSATFIRKCTQQKKYVQDIYNVNNDGAKHRG